MRKGKRIRTTYFVTRTSDTGGLEAIVTKYISKARKLFAKNGLGIWKQTLHTKGYHQEERIARR